MKTCRICRASFDPAAPTSDPAVEAGLFMAREVYKDEGEICASCLANRGRLTMMYCNELD